MFRWCPNDKFQKAGGMRNKEENNEQAVKTHAHINKKKESLLNW
jgi:hypothetical protein